MLQIAEAVELTDTGRQREANEDSYFARAPLFAVADGMGGAQAGEVASRMAVDAFERADADTASPEQLLRETAELANHEIFELAQGDSTRSGMGTTLTAALVRGDEISFGHVGDSRAYVLREGRLKQITNDHSLVEELRRQGKLTRDQAAEHPQRSVITRALGPEPHVEVDTMTFRARPGDVILLCSDGLTTMLSDEDVAAIMNRGEGLERAAQGLIDAANERGGRDNITVVLFRLGDGGGEAPTPATTPADEEATLLGSSAAERGLTADAVRAGAAAGGAGAAASGTRAARPARRSRRSDPEPAPSRRRRWPRRLLKGGIALLVLAAVVAAAIIGARQVWFLGTNDADQVAIFRGLPYELPFGIDLYSEQRASPASLTALPEERRPAVTEHELRSREDAVSLLEDLERTAASAAAQTPAAGGGGGRDGGGSGTGTGSGGGSGKAEQGSGGGA